MFSCLIIMLIISNVLPINFASLMPRVLQSLMGRGGGTGISTVQAAPAGPGVSGRQMFPCCFIPRSFSKNINKTDQSGTWHAVLETYHSDQRKRQYKYLENQRENSQTPIPESFYFHLKVETSSFACITIEMHFFLQFFV